MPFENTKARLIDKRLHKNVFLITHNDRSFITFFSFFYSTGEFQLLQLFVLAMFGALD